MATSNTSPTNPSRKATATSFRASKPNSKSDWLGLALLAAKTITAGAECVPFPYVKGAFGMIIVLLETVEKAKKNRDDLKELCENSMEIMKIVQDQIASHGPTAAEKLKSVCEELESALKVIVDEVTKWQDAPRGFRSRVKEMVKSSSITDKISEYQNKVQTLCSNLKICLLPKQPRVSTIVLHHPAYSMEDKLSLLKCNSILPRTWGNSTYTCSMGSVVQLKFIDGSAHKFSDIFLIDTSTLETIDTGLKRIAATKNIGDTAQDALDWLRSKGNEWLLFFDNADDPKIDLHSFFPRCKHGNILITSRNPELRGYGSHSLVSDMEEIDAVELLLRSAAQDITPENKDTATEIVKALWYLPLAIVQAGAFILKSGSLNSYLELYAKNREQLLKQKPAQSHDDYAWTVYTTWQISFVKLSQTAVMLLQLCSFLHHGGISEQIFKNASLYSFPTSGPSKQELQIPVQFLSHFLGPDGAWDSLCFWNVTNELQAYSLINFDAARNVFSIHPLVHSWTRNTFTNEESHHSCMTALLGMSIAGISDEDIELASLALLPHIDSLSSVGARTDFTAQYGRILLKAHKYKRAEELLAQAVQKQRRVLGDDHVATLDLMGHLGTTYEKLGQYKLAEQLLTLVVEKGRKHLGEDHPDTLVAMFDLAWTYVGLGQFKEAAELQTVVAEKRRQTLGEDHPSTLLAMNDLAATNSHLGQYKAAEEIQIAMLDRRRKISGDDHPETLTVMNNLGLVYWGLGQLQKAEQLLSVMEKRRKILGEDHPKTLISMNNLALTFRNLELQVVVLEKRQKILGDEHPETLIAMSNLGLTYRGLGNFKAAVELQIDVLEKRKKILTDNHPQILVVMSNLGSTYHTLHMDKEAEKLQTVVLEKRRKVLGENHPGTLRSMNDLAMTYHSMSRFKEAEELQIATLEKRRNILGEEHPATMFSMNNLAMVYHSLERFQEATELLMMVLEKLRKLNGADHPDTLLTVHNLALVYHSIGQLKDAEELQSAVLENLNQFKEAEELQRAGLEKQRNILGEAHPDTLLSMKNLALTYHSLDWIQEAEELQQKLRNILARPVENAEELQVM
ncbi:hypothetical protein FB451DRAFT_1481993 [Mycena latifolia]|nr:hypothetical protein FB451DRAFT_1481993 [Mycena latifolia]